MNIKIRQESFDQLSEHVRVPNTFEVPSVLDIVEQGSGVGETNTFELTQRVIESPYVKDYDALEDPLTWPGRFDLSNGVLLAAYISGQRAGGAIIAFDVANLDTLSDGHDVAVLWDLRVAPGFRRQGIGRALFAAAEQETIGRGGVAIQVETQNNNIAACRFYERQNCTLMSINRAAYTELPSEIQMIWRKHLSPTD